MEKHPGANKYPHVFQPLRIGPVEVPNRIYMGPHGIRLEASAPDWENYNVPAAEAAYYYGERAAGGVGLIFHSQRVAPLASDFLASSPLPKKALPSYQRVAEFVHRHGAKIMAQVHYTAHGQYFWEPLGPSAPVLRASAIKHGNLPRTSREIRKDEIRRLVEVYGQAARHLREVGYDGVEIHASHGVLHEHFLSPRYNRRDDEYGGTLENRMRFLVETLEEVRREAGPQLAVGVRLSADQPEWGPEGYTDEDARQMFAYLASKKLCDFIDIDLPQEYVTPIYVPKLHIADRVARVSEAAKPLVRMTVPGRVTTMQEAEMLIGRGVADMVGAVRGLIAEPDLVKNAREGHEERSRPCVAVNQCFEGPFMNARYGGFGCALNPAAGKEERWGAARDAQAPRKMKVLIVGAGPAGLEAARVAALRGHTVSVVERRNVIGGALALWAKLPGCENLITAVDWWDARLREQGVEVRTGVEADARSILAQSPDVVIVATGSQYVQSGESASPLLEIPGWDQDFVYTPEAVLEDGASLNGKVIVVDEEGLYAGVGIAEIAAAAGARVELVTSSFLPGASLTLSQGVGRVVGKRLRDAGVTVSPMTSVTRIGPHRATLVGPDGEERVVDGVDAVVMATMRKPLDGLHDSLQGRIKYPYLIGDALSPRKLREATYEGQRFARLIGEEAMPESVMDELLKPGPGIRPAAFA